MTPERARKERARLEAEVNNGVAAGGTQRRAKAVAMRERARLAHDLEIARTQAVREGKPDSKHAADLAAELAALPTEAECDVSIDRAARAERDARTELEYLLLDELATFCDDAAVLSEAAQGQFSALELPIEQAQRAAQVAQVAWSKLGPALSAKLRERDEATGTYSPVSVYQRLTAFPSFPVQISDPNWSARPAGAPLVTAKQAKAKAAA
jgi:hypothetical protein